LVSQFNYPTLCLIRYQCLNLTTWLLLSPGISSKQCIGTQSTWQIRSVLVTHSTTVQAARSWLLSAEPQVQSLVMSYEICGWPVALKQVFIRVSSVSPGSSSHHYSILTQRRLLRRAIALTRQNIITFYVCMLGASYLTRNLNHHRVK
jgi:hypothetical protein